MNERELKKRVNEFMKGFDKDKVYSHNAVRDVIFLILKEEYMRKRYHETK